MKKSLFVLMAALVVVGAGCFDRDPEPTPAPNVNTNTSVTPTPSAPEPTTPPVTTDPGAPAAPATSTIELPPIDQTWQTYTNRALNFSFRWPSRGRYAPEWEVFFAKDTDAKIQNDCYVEDITQRGSPSPFTVGGVNFCHTRFEDHATSQTFFTDDYTTKKGSQYIVLRFKKRAVSAAPTDCTKVSPETLLVNQAACIPFDLPTWEATLDQIVGTFTYSE